MDKYENSVKYNIAETCCASISVQDLQNLSEQKDAVVIPSATKLTYGHIRGSPELRTNLANLYSSRAGTPLPPENILITPGAIAANLLCCYALIKPGDHVVVHYPTYQQLYSVPESLGAEVSLWKATAEKNWVPDLDDLKSLVRETTKLVVLNNPNNPTGAVLPRKLLQGHRGLSRAPGHTYTLRRGLPPGLPFHFANVQRLPAEHSLARLRKHHRHGLAVQGVQPGGHPRGLDRVAQPRDHRSHRRGSALHHHLRLAARRGRRGVCARAAHGATRCWAATLPSLRRTSRSSTASSSSTTISSSTCAPLAGTTAFLRFHRDSQPVDSEALCARLADEAGVLWAPGASSFGDEFKGYVRIGFVCETEVLKDGLEAARKWLRKEFDDLELAT